MNSRTEFIGFDRASHVRRPSALPHARGLWRGFATTGTALISLAAIMISPALAQTTPTTLRVETFVVAPFVMERGDALTGFSVDLWEEVAARLKVKTTYEKAPNISAGWKRCARGKATSRSPPS